AGGGLDHHGGEAYSASVKRGKQDDPVACAATPGPPQKGRATMVAWWHSAAAPESRATMVAWWHSAAAAKSRATMVAWWHSAGGSKDSCQLNAMCGCIQLRHRTCDVRLHTAPSPDMAGGGGVSTAARTRGGAGG